MKWKEEREIWRIENKPKNQESLKQLSLIFSPSTIHSLLSKAITRNPEQDIIIPVRDVKGELRTVAIRIGYWYYWIKILGEDEKKLRLTYEMERRTENMEDRK